MAEMTDPYRLKVKVGEHEFDSRRGRIHGVEMVEKSLEITPPARDEDGKLGGFLQDSGGVIGKSDRTIACSPG